ncbi:TetR/AcrR family transcriptional regulator [Rhodococcus spelaei]|uniref:TetR/AcrR family transcriptional regulator n=1 Tax=Rhodococcus spelaei TaxID=2546320 RepID=A0A541BAQ0_9NOCA|nr:TetR/AcrR family transcriptional regulator [Rhodococcus spelaei]TQF69379.1 TetR/AcrR family transcriptional regulator [Rhodococcus spelaei]
MNIVSTVTGGRRLRADAERNRRKILDAAADLFATRGIDITLDDVARHAKVGVGTVYRRFTCKQELVDGVFQQHMDDMVDAATGAMQCADPWDGLVEFVALTCERMALNRGMGDVFFTSDDGREQIACARERVTPIVDALIVRAQDAGELRPDVTVNDLFTVSRMIESVIDFTRPVAPEAWRRYLGLVLDGMRAEGAARTPLSAPSLTDEQVEEAKAACVRR